MYRLLSDLRILRLAEDMEHTLEGYERDLRDRIPEVPVRARLNHLFEPGKHHDALRAALQEFSARAAAESQDLSTDEILQTMLDCERVAHQFYLFQLDNLSDQRLVVLFARLAEEERQHIAAVEDAIRIQATVRQAARPVADPPAA